ncbi:PD-(D/E)XK nuclease family protein [Gloeobacter violaceus]|uniref:Glr4129 protein n=1 Tax=Gloeobacter violaceus (strain ATCC 29082 / PCC 7421) TaxID=251221 RepID=Q7NDV3_GLOVI|nr:PD-(D/E)XK nuclease family protein [Gloeobacter violaceus]BAC92070.1 glr4129 [Gloeobacter violaceus PCC 7421]
MSLPLSASRLVRYATCPRAYAWKYRYHYPEPGGGGRRQRLGILLHATLGRFWQDWLGRRGDRSLGHLERLWRQGGGELEKPEQTSGWHALESYYLQEVRRPEPPRPFASEGRLRHSLVLDRVDVQFESRYDLLLWGEPDRRGVAGIDLVEFKTARQVRSLSQLEADLQLSCYILGIGAQYGQALRTVSHYYLLSGEKLTFAVQPHHQRYALEKAQRLVANLLDGGDWEPKPGSHCRRCGYRSQCDLSNPRQLPPESAGYARPEQPLVLTLF